MIESLIWQGIAIVGMASSDIVKHFDKKDCDKFYRRTLESCLKTEKADICIEKLNKIKNQVGCKL